MAYLSTVAGLPAGQRWPLVKPKAVLGRHPHCDVVIDVGAVSRQHAQIERIDDDFYVRDLGSRNGTYLNDRLVRSPQRLADGDRIRICDVVLGFTADRPAPGASGSLILGDGSTYSAVLIDDDAALSGSTVMSRLDVSRSSGSVHIAASAEVKLGALLAITRNLGKALSLDEVLPQVLDSLFKIFVQADRGFIVLRDEEGRLVPRWTKFRRGEGDQTIRISRTIIHRVMESKEAILSADAASDSRFDMSESIVDFQIRSMICCPLLDSEGNAFGALQIDTLDQRQRFREEDLEVLVSVATQAAIAIDNAQLHDRTLRQQAIERDLDLARKVQRGFLPERPPTLDGYSFFDYYQPASSVGGDYFDYVAMPDGRIAVVVADVTGHGVAAALLMAKLSAEIRFSLATQLRPAAALTQLNATFCAGNVEDRFVTLVMAVLNPRTHELTVVNAGHMPPLLRQADGDLVEVGQQEVGLPMGVLGDTEYEQATVGLKPGELVALYTDGINEAMNDRGEQYGLDRVRRQTRQTAEDAQRLGANIIDDVRQFIGARPQSDDMCLVCFGRVWVAERPRSSGERAGATAIY